MNPNFIKIIGKNFSKFIFIFMVFILVVAGLCDKNKNAGNQGAEVQISPFWDRYGQVQVNTQVDLCGLYKSNIDCKIHVEIWDRSGVNKLKDFSGQYSATSGIWKSYSFSWTPNQVNEYWIKQYICDLAGNNVTGTTKSICHVTETPQPHIEIWAGDRRTGNKYDRLDQPICYKLKVRLTKEGVPMITEGIQFSITSVPSVNTSGHYLQETGLVSTDQHGIAENILFLGDEEGTYKVTASYTENGNQCDIVFEEYCFDDYEYSNLSTGHTHEKLDYPGTEIPGDGYDDYPDTYKDVKIEVDYYTGISNIGKDDIKSVLNSWLPEILWTAGLNVSYLEKDSTIDKDGIDDAISSMPAYLDRQECKGLLAQHRDFNSAIHIIIGTSREVGRWGETYGILVQYWDDGLGVGEPGFDEDSCAHYGSGDPSYTQDYLDSCGIIIFGEDFPSPATIGMGWGGM